MLFNSLIFLYAFLPVAYFVFWKLRGKFPRHLWLAVTGYVFYSFWNYKFCALMLTSTLVSYLAGLALLRWQDPFRRRLCLIVPVTVDLALLGVFKYANFALTSLNDLSSRWGGHWSFTTLDVILPVGISFYTFHTVTYIVDAYRGVITPTRSFVEFASYVSLFPQLVAGPIVRFRQIEDDLGDVDRAERRADLDTGWSFFAIGFIKKVLIADTIGGIVTPALADYAHLSTVGAWLCLLGFAYQIYFDFSGYSDMAVGLGYMFGLRLPRTSTPPTRRRTWPTSGGAGTSPCRRSSATTCSCRSEAGAGRACALPQPDAHHAPGRALARRRVDLRHLGRLSWARCSSCTTRSRPSGRPFPCPPGARGRSCSSWWGSPSSAPTASRWRCSSWAPCSPGNRARLRSARRSSARSS